MDPKDYPKVLADPEEVKRRIHGSKLVIGLEQCMLFSTWGVKTCMISMYWRMTRSLKIHIYVQILAAYAAIGLIVIEITYYGVYCRPFSQYWAMPVENEQCATYRNYSITQAVFNISSDAAMLVVPIPVLAKAQLNRRKTLLLGCVMSLGLFVIVAAILNKYFNFSAPLNTIYMVWYIREASTAIYVANLMCWWPLLRKLFGWSAFQSYGSGKRNTYDGYGYGTTRGGRNTTHVRSTNLSARHSVRTPLASRMSNMSATLRGSTPVTSISEEAINEATGGRDVPLQIWHKVEYEIEEERDGNNGGTAGECPYDAHQAAEEGQYHATVEAIGVAVSGPDDLPRPSSKNTGNGS